MAAWIELQTQTLSAPTIKQRLAAIRHLFDWLVIGQMVPHNPAASVRGPSHTARQGKTPVLDTVEARQLLDSIDVSTPIGLRDRALIGLMVFSFARVGAALAMRVEDVYVQNTPQYHNGPAAGSFRPLQRARKCRFRHDRKVSVGNISNIATAFCRMFVTAHFALAAAAGR